MNTRNIHIIIYNIALLHSISRSINSQSPRINCIEPEVYTEMCYFTLPFLIIPPLYSADIDKHYSHHDYAPNENLSNKIHLT